jgi:U3 small nucleolar RNA-associated protein 22
VLDKENSSRKVERGPAPGTGDLNEMSSELAEFKRFWGEKSELRRFKDGSIVESVIWDDCAADTKRYHPYHVIENIVKYIVPLHLPINHDCITAILPVLEPIHSFQFNHFVSAKKQQDSILPNTLKLFITSTRSQQYLQIMNTFDDFKALMMTRIQNLPLQVDSLTPISSEFRQTSLALPERHPFVFYEFFEENLRDRDFVESVVKQTFLKDLNGLKFNRFVHPLNVILKFESSNKWPKDPKAVTKCKNAFLLKIKFELRKQFKVSSNCLF